MHMYNFIENIFSHKLHPNHIFPLLLSSQFLPTPLSKIHSVSLSSVLKTGFQEATVSQDRGRYNKTSQKYSHRDLTRQPNRRKSAPRTDNRVRQTPTFTLKSTTNYQAKNHSIYSEDRVQIMQF